MHNCYLVIKLAMGVQFSMSQRRKLECVGLSYIYCVREVLSIGDVLRSLRLKGLKFIGMIIPTIKRHFMSFFPSRLVYI